MFTTPIKKSGRRSGLTGRPSSPFVNPPKSRAINTWPAWPKAKVTIAKVMPVVRKAAPPVSAAKTEVKKIAPKIASRKFQLKSLIRIAVCLEFVQSAF